MNIIDLRTNPRRLSTTKRIAERRKFTNEFGSTEWLKHIKNHNLDCPNLNRRIAERRNDNRRLPDRREHYGTEHNHNNNNFARVFLTPAKKHLIEDLYLTDLE